MENWIDFIHTEIKQDQLEFGIDDSYAIFVKGEERPRFSGLKWQDARDRREEVEVAQQAIAALRKKREEDRK